MREGRGTSASRWVWTIVWGTLTAVGGALNVAAHGWSATIGVAVVVASLCAGFYYNRPDRAGRKPHDGLLSTMSLGAIGTVSTAGWVTTLGPGALLLIVAAGLSWPGTYAYLASRPQIRARLGRLHPPTSQPSPPARHPTVEPGRAVTFPATSGPAAARPIEPPTPVKTLTDEQLGQAWRASFKSLEHSFVISDTAQQAELVSRRQQYLDEFEDRNPHGFARWLASGDRPAGDLSRFL